MEKREVNQIFILVEQIKINADILLNAYQQLSEGTLKLQEKYNNMQTEFNIELLELKEELALAMIPKTSTEDVK